MNHVGYRCGILGVLYSWKKYRPCRGRLLTSDLLVFVDIVVAEHMMTTRNWDVYIVLPVQVLACSVNDQIHNTWFSKARTSALISSISCHPADGISDRDVWCWRRTTKKPVVPTVSKPATVSWFIWLVAELYVRCTCYVCAVIFRVNASRMILMVLSETLLQHGTFWILWDRYVLGLKPIC